MNLKARAFGLYYRYIAKGINFVAESLLLVVTLDGFLAERSVLSLPYHSVRLV